MDMWKYWYILMDMYVWMESISVLIVGNFFVAAFDLAGVGVWLEMICFSALQEGSRVSVEPKLIQKDWPQQAVDSGSVGSSGNALPKESFVGLGQDGQRRSVLHHILELGIVGDIHSSVYIIKNLMLSYSHYPSFQLLFITFFSSDSYFSSSFIHIHWVYK